MSKKNHWNIFYLLFIIFFSLSIRATTSNCSEIIISGNPEYPPYLWRDKTNPQLLNGVFRYILDDIASQTGRKIKVIYSGPWGRVQKNAFLGQIDMIAGVFYKAERAKYMDYLKPGIHFTGPAIIVNKKKSKNYAKWEDLISERGITVINNSFGEVFDNYARAHLNIHIVPTIGQALRMLEANRVDYLVYEYNAANIYMNQLGITTLKASPIMIPKAELYLTISKESACNTEQIRNMFEQVLINAQNNRDKKMEQYLARAEREMNETQALLNQSNIELNK
ncbi:substrate-binding periplasmic protein [Aeromonas aquatilis]